MSNWMRYLLEANAYLCVSYGLYWLLLRKQTFYTANRAYLLLSIMVCFALPAIKVSFEPVASAMKDPVAKASTMVVHADQRSTTLSQLPVLKPFKAAKAIYLLGCASTLVLTSMRLYSVLKLIAGRKVYVMGNYTVVKVANAKVPFSFLHYLFVSDEADVDDTILRHECVHMRQNHSIDILITEVLKSLCWFNPVVYLLQNSLKAVHEYEADRCAALDEPDRYVDLLIGQACLSSGIPLTSDFSDTKLLKTRIMKLYQKRSGRLARLNYLAALPLSVGMLLASSAAFSKDHSLITVHLVGSGSPTTTHYRSKYFDSKHEVSVDIEKATVQNILMTPGYKGPVKFPPPMTTRDTNQKGPIKFPPPSQVKHREKSNVKFPPPAIDRGIEASSSSKASAIPSAEGVVPPPPPPPALPRSSKARAIRGKNGSIPPPPPPVSSRIRATPNSDGSIPPPPPPPSTELSSTKAKKHGKIKHI